MCGIAGVYLKNKRASTPEGVEEFANELLLGIEKRGRQATGFIAVGWDGDVMVDKAAKGASEFVKEREPFPKDVQAVLLHTRFATQGTVEEMGNNHPVSYQTCFATHNGHISNDDDLFKDEALGLVRRFEVDSEAIPAVLWKHTLETPETIKGALEKLHGDMAIAAVDPIKYPSKLVLAKGANSPLHIFENENVIIWASLPEVIREAWAKLLGTPMNFNKIKSVGWGKFLVVEDYKNLVEHSFTAHASSRYTYGDWGRGNDYTPRNRNNIRVLDKPSKGGICRPWDTTGPFMTKGAFDAALRLYLVDKTITGKRSRTWEQRNNDELTPEDLADVKSVVAWHKCPTCERSILREDFQIHLKYGAICKDCITVTATKWRTNNEEDAKKEEPTEVRIPQLIPKDRANLESWALVEAKVHRFTLETLSDETGYSAHTLDFLIFRTAATAADFGSNMVHLKYVLKKRYDLLYEETHIVLGKEIMREVAHESTLSVEKAQEKAAEQLYPWTAFSETVLGRKTKQIRYECSAHGERFDYGETCINCLDEDIESTISLDEQMSDGDTVGGITGDTCGVRVFDDAAEVGDDEEAAVVGGLVKCEDCSNWIIPGNPCASCEAAHNVLTKMVIEAQDKKVLNAGPSPASALPALPDLPKNCRCKTARKRPCKMGVTVAKEVNGKLVGFCRNHWSNCSIKDCKEKANYTTTDGQRFCHKDARRKPGESDSSAGNAARIMEMKREVKQEAKK